MEKQRRRFTAKVKLFNVHIVNALLTEDAAKQVVKLIQKLEKEDIRQEEEANKEE